MTGRDAVLQVCLIGLLLTVPAFATAQEGTAAQEEVSVRQDPYWPSEREERLEEIQSAILDRMRRMPAATYYQRGEEVEQLTRELEVLRSEQARLMAQPVRSETAAQ
jgi:hypothetical protein